ncbi:MAG: type II toxin-antitoxin system RelE/ParE family toxin [Chloroflexi bacterium]|nr:type II toxin-antitoxin system RelE/ParE family toxin [Chloroflexota bacterium]
MKLDIKWRAECLQELSELTIEQRDVIEQTVEELCISPNQGRPVRNAYSNFREIIVGGCRIFYLIMADTIKVTGLRQI